MMRYRLESGLLLLKTIPPAVPLLIVYTIIGLIFVPSFLSVGNITSILYSAAVLVPAVVGTQLLLTLGRFDLSTGSTAALSGMLTGICLLRFDSTLLAVLIGITVGLLAGILTGMVVAYIRIDPLIATLAVMGIGRSLSLVANGGGVVAGLPSRFGRLAEARIHELPVLILIACATILLAAFLTRNAVLFRRFYAAGSNPTAAGHSGINVKALVVFGYLLAGIGAATTGIIQSSRTLSASPQIFDSLAIDCIAACIIGGSSLAGGRGGTLGAALGLIVIASTDNMVIMLNIPLYWRSFVEGMLLLLVVAWSPARNYLGQRLKTRKGQVKAMKLCRRFLFTATLATLVFGSGCGRDETGSTDSAKPTRTYAMSLYVVGLPFWSDTKSTWDAIGNQPGVKTLYSGPVDGDAQKQIQDIETMITRKVDGIVVSASDSAALIPVINKAVASGIPVVTYLNDAPKSKRMTNITSELEESSLKVGRAALANTTQPATAVISCADAGNEEQTARRHGFEMLAQQNPQLKIVAVVEDNFDESKGAQAIKPLLSKFPKLTYIFGCNSRSAVGAVSALKEMGAKPGQVTITGWDEDEDVLNLVAQGWVKYSVAQTSAFMTQIAFAILRARSEGNLYPKNRQFEQYGISPVPERITVPVSLIMSANFNGFYPKRQLGSQP